VSNDGTTTAQPVAGDGRVAPLPDAETCRHLLELMALIRRFEEEAGRQYQRAKAGGFLHLAIGEEATIVGTTSAMEADDYLIGTYRTHGERRFMGGYGVVGGNLPIAIGLALASDYRGEETATVCMFGDGASNTGNFGETMNLAALWKLPLVFIVENNLYGMGTSIERHSAVTDLSKKAEGLGVPGTRVDGMDVLAVRECVIDRLRVAREERRPTLIEAFTYRFRGHSAADPEVYRTKEEVEEWRQKDPIEAFNARLVAEGTIADGDLDELRGRAEERVMDAVAFADASPEPPLESLYDNLYVVGDQVTGWYAVDERTPAPHRGEAEREAAAAAQVRELAEAGAAYAGQPLASAGRQAGDEIADRDEGEAVEERLGEAEEAEEG
jgi:pyruvate dehydrogenase E1 component alpha subunit